MTPSEGKSNQSEGGLSQVMPSRRSRNATSESQKRSLRAIDGFLGLRAN